MMNVSIKSVDLINENHNKRILQNISFSLDAGNVYTILGKNGSGKSTLINTLTKLLDNSIYNVDASIEFEGRDLFKLSEKELLQIRKEKIRYVFQDSVNSFDPLKNFGYYFRLFGISEEESKGVLEYFLLPDKEKLFRLYPYEVSGGMAQRISICLAILSKPGLLVLDEPTSAIDINISNLLCDKLRQFVAGHKSCVLLITQDIDFAEHVSDFTAQLIDGNLSPFMKLPKT